MCSLLASFKFRIEANGGPKGGVHPPVTPNRIWWRRDVGRKCFVAGTQPTAIPHWCAIAPKKILFLVRLSAPLALPKKVETAANIQ